MEFNVNDDDIVISGISVRLPKSKDADEFAYNLYNKVSEANQILHFIISHVYTQYIQFL